MRDRRGQRSCHRDCGCRAGTGRRDPGDHPLDAICGPGHQERLGEHHRRQNRRRRGCRRRRERQGRVGDPGDPEPEPRPSGHRFPRQDPRRVNPQSIKRSGRR